MTEQLPARLRSGGVTPATVCNTSCMVPALIAEIGAGGLALCRILRANIRNPNTRRAYARACDRFFGWCEDRGLTLATIRAFDVGAWVDQLQENHGAAGVKQQLAAVRMLCDWLVFGQVMPMNPATAARGPKHVVKTGKSTVLDGEEWRKPLGSIPTGTVRDLRDRALIAALTYSFARVTAALRTKVEDLRSKGSGWQIMLHEKGGREHAMPCHHALAEMPRAYMDAAGIAEDRNGWLFRTSPRRNATVLTEQPMSQADAWRMIRRRAIAAGIFAPTGNHTFRATGITAYLGQRWRARTRAIHGRTPEPADNEALRSDAGTAHAGRGGADPTIAAVTDRACGGRRRHVRHRLVDSDIIRAVTLLVRYSQLYSAGGVTSCRRLMSLICAPTARVAGRAEGDAKVLPRKGT